MCRVGSGGTPYTHGPRRGVQVLDSDGDPHSSTPRMGWGWAGTSRRRPRDQSGTHTVGSPGTPVHWWSLGEEGATVDSSQSPVCDVSSSVFRTVHPGTPVVEPTPSRVTEHASPGVLSLFLVDCCLCCSWVFRSKVRQSSRDYDCRWVRRGAGRLS